MSESQPTSGEVVPMLDPQAFLSRLRAPRGGLAEARALASAGAQGPSLLLEALEDPQPRVRAFACCVLGEIQMPASEVIPALRRRVDDVAHEVRFVASHALQRITGQLSGAEQDPLGVPAIEQLDAIKAQRVERLLHSLENENRIVREDAIDEIRLMWLDQCPAAGAQRVAEMIATRLLEDDDDQCRYSAALALSSLLMPARYVIDALCIALDDPYRDVQLAAAKALAAHGLPAAAALPRLERLLAESSYASTRRIIENAITRVRGAVPDPC